MDAQNGITLYIQSGIIPFRRQDDHIEILLITNKKKDKWGIPKGLVESGLSASESAQKEAFEEAGIYGRIYKPSLGKYSIKKWDGKCRIKVFAMEVTQTLDKWPEDILRRREWYSVEEAAGKIKNRKLQAMILGLPEFLEE
ncbi:MAG: NUDIX hydrolase [Spirochaetia bacterium]|nr:NUDIX hydrolase [Spirochaetia bacterium]